jgi:hypothetical protein
MAIAAWYVPKSLYSRKFWDRFPSPPSKAVLVSIIVAIYLFPVSFVFWRVATWQFPYQHAIDQGVFDQVKVVLQKGPVTCWRRRTTSSLRRSTSPLSNG